MAEVTVPFHVQVLTWHPALGRMEPVPGVQVKMKDDVVCTDPELASGTTGADGKVRLEVRYQEGRQNGFNPYFVLSLPEGSRSLPTGGIEELRLPLPASWETRHSARERARGRVDRHQQAADAFKIFYGLPATLRLDYVDFHPSRKGNPLSLPERTVRVHLADYDVFIWDCFDCLNPDDPLQGKGFNPHRPAVVDAGHHDEIPYFDVWPTALHPLDSAVAGEDRALRAWIDPPGAPIGSLGGGSFAAVGGMATDPHGFVWMIDGDRVHRFYPDGTLAETIESWTADGREDRLLVPEGLAVDEERVLYVADTGHDRLVIFQLLNGRYAFTATADLFEGGGDPLSPLPDVSLNGPRALAVVPGGGNRLAVVYGRATLRVALIEFSLIGDLVTHKRGQAVASPAELPQPAGVAADSGGRLYVSDRGRHQITRWDPSGPGGAYALAATWGRPDGTAGPGNGELSDPVALALDRVQRWLYVAEAGNRRVQRFDLDSADGAPRFIWAPEVDGGRVVPAGLAVDPRGDVFLADGAHARVLRATPYEQDGAPRTAPPRLLGVPWLPRTDRARMAGPTCVLFDSEGRMLVSDTGNGRVLRFRRQEDGSFGPAAADATPFPLASPTGLALAPDGDLFVAETGGNLLRRLGPDLAHRGPVGNGRGSGDGQLSAPCGLALRRVGSEDPLLLIADRDNDRVEVWELDGTFVRRLPAATPALSKPEDVAVDDLGIVFVADTGNRRIVSFLPRTDGGSGERFGSAITVADPGFQLVAPSGVSLDGNDLIVTDRGAGRVLRLDRNGGLKAFWDLQPFVTQISVIRAPGAGTVALRGLTLGDPQTFEGRSGRPARSSGILAFTKTGEATSTDYKVSAGSLLFVTDGQTVALRDWLFFSHWQGFDERHFLDLPELARQVLLDRPSRALLDERGLLAIADTGRDRIRLVRVRTDCTVTLFETGEGALDTLPDISFRARTRGEWGDELALNMTVGDPSSSDPFTLSTRPQDDQADEFSGDRYEKRHTFDDGRWNPAIHTLKLARQIQRWLQHLTRADEAEHRWGRGTAQRLDADLVRRPRESFFSWDERMISLNSQVGERGFDAWTDWVVAHEMGHWIMYASVPNGFPFRPFYPDHHSSDLLLNRGVALLEGFAESCELFFSGSTDRVRGYSRSALSNVFDNPEVPATGRSLYTGLAASPGATPPPAPEQGLRNEGYFANTLWQIHHALIEPEILFADAPSFWYPWSASVSSDRSALFCRLLRRPWRTLPAIPEADVTQGGTDYFLRRLLAEAHALAAESAAFAHVPQVVQAIFEINNQLTPRLTLTAAGPGGQPGDGLPDPVALPVGTPREMVARVLDGTGAPLAGYNLRFTLPDAAASGLSFPGPAPEARHGLAVAPAQAPIQGLQTTDAYRATDAQGIVRFTFTPPPGSAGTVLLRVSYQPEFSSDRTLTAPARGDRRDAVLRQLYLKRLATAGPTDSTGALIERTVTFQVRV